MSVSHPIRPCAEFPNDNTDLHAGSRWLLAHPASSIEALLPEGPSVPFEAPPLQPAAHQRTTSTADAPEATIAVLEEHSLEATTPPLLELRELEPIDADDPFLAELAAFVERAELHDSPPPCIEETPTQKLRPVNRSAQPLVPLHFELTPLPPQASEWSELIAVLTEHLLRLGHTRASALIGPLLNAELVDLSRLEPSVLEQLQRDGVACPRGTRMVSSPTFRSSAHVFREELGNGGLEPNEALFWLAQLIGALLGNNDEHDTLESSLRELGITRLFERAA
jgi:hypothetical protein